MGVITVGSCQGDRERCARTNIHEEIGIVCHAQIGTTIAETATRCVVCRCEGADMRAVPQYTTHLWSADDVDETVLKSRLHRELSPDLIGPGVFVQAEVGDSAT